MCILSIFALLGLAKLWKKFSRRELLLSLRSGFGGARFARCFFLIPCYSDFAVARWVQILLSGRTSEGVHSINLCVSWACWALENAFVERAAVELAIGL